jgi:nitrous oxidase accessory protein
MRSFIVDLMDAMEKVFPSFTPEKLLDEQPSMVRW